MRATCPMCVSSRPREADSVTSGDAQLADGFRAIDRRSQDCRMIPVTDSGWVWNQTRFQRIGDLEDAVLDAPLRADSQRLTDLLEGDANVPHVLSKRHLPFLHGDPADVFLDESDQFVLRVVARLAA